MDKKKYKEKTMIEPTERETELLEIIRKLFRILTIFSIYDENMYKIRKWMSKAMQEEMAIDFETETIKYLDEEFGLKYQKIKID